MIKLFLHIKALIKNRTTWILILSLCFFIMVLKSISLPKDQGTVGIYNYDVDAFTDFVIYEDENELIKDVASGRIDCGFSFPDDFNEKMENDRLKGSITYINSVYTKKGLVAKEKLYAFLLKSLGPKMMHVDYESFYGEFDEDKYRKLLEKREFYLEGQDIFTVDFSGDIK